MKTHLRGANQTTLCGTWRTAQIVASNPTCKTCLRCARKLAAEGVR